LFGLFLVVFSTKFVQAEAALEIRVEGTQRIEPSTVRSYVSIAKGEKISRQVMDATLKKLFSTGLFADVVVRREDNVIVIKLVENPIINRIAFEGNKRITDDVLESEVKLRPRVVYTRTRVQREIQRLIDVYRRNGRFAAIVVPKVIQLPQNRVDLVFEIKEGPITEIRRISFVGNQKFSDSELRSVIRTTEAAWYKLFLADDKYDPDRLTFDRELLRRFYLNQGFADFRVVSAVAELAPDREGFFVTFTLEEGERYKFGKVDIAATLPDLSLDELKSYIKIKKGDWYNADAVEKVVLKLSDVIGTFGYAFVNIRPRVSLNKENKILNVSFSIQEGRRVFVERINITGNDRTIDPVIRREMSLVEGDPFNISKMRESKKNIRSLGFFDLVQVKKSRGSKSDKAVVNVKIEERSTGEVNFGAGFSSDNGFAGDFGIRERNFLGKGQDVKFKTKLASGASEIDVSFTEPYFLDRRLAAGFDLFRTTKDLKDESSFERQSMGSGLRLGFHYSSNLSQRLRYTFSHEEVTNVATTASLAIQEEAGSAVKSEFSQTLTYDTRDRRRFPKSGSIMRFDSDLSGFG
jgi:outer membrane protein insertion porin family